MWIIWSEFNGALKRLSAMRVQSAMLERGKGRECVRRSWGLEGVVVSCGTCVRRHFYSRARNHHSVKRFHPFSRNSIIDEVKKEEKKRNLGTLFERFQELCFGPKRESEKEKPQFMVLSCRRVCLWLSINQGHQQISYDTTLLDTTLSGKVEPTQWAGGQKGKNSDINLSTCLKWVFLVSFFT